MAQCLAAIAQTLQNLEAKPRNDADALAIAVHACLDSEGFRLVSVGEENLSKDRANDLVKIPSTWNAADDVYTFSYRHNEASGTFLFKLLLVDDTLIVHAVSEKTDDVLILELKYVRIKTKCTMWRLILLCSGYQTLFNTILHILTRGKMQLLRYRDQIQFDLFFSTERIAFCVKIYTDIEQLFHSVKVNMVDKLLSIRADKKSPLR